VFVCLCEGCGWAGQGRAAASELTCAFMCAPHESQAHASHGASLFVAEVGEALRRAGSLSARITGRLARIDRTLCRAALVDARAGVTSEVVVDVSQVIGQLFHDGELVQVLGELSPPALATDPPTLRARILRNVDGLDLEAFERAVAGKHKFMAERGLA